MTAGAKSLQLVAVEVEPMGGTQNTAFERGHYTFFKEDGKTIFDEGK